MSEAPRNPDGSLRRCEVPGPMRAGRVTFCDELFDHDGATHRNGSVAWVVCELCGMLLSAADADRAHGAKGRGAHLPNGTPVRSSDMQ